jgi:hypothetical protein
MWKQHSCPGFRTSFSPKSREVDTTLVEVSLRNVSKEIVTHLTDEADPGAE